MARYDPCDFSEPPPSTRILAAIRHGKSDAVGEMLKKDPGLVYTVDPHAIIDNHYLYSQRPPLAIFAADHGQETLARAIGVFSATGHWNEFGKWPAARSEVAARQPAAQTEEPVLGPKLVEAVRTDTPQTLPAITLAPAA